MTTYVLAPSRASFDLWRPRPAPINMVYVVDPNQLYGLGADDTIFKVGDWTANPHYQERLLKLLEYVDIAESYGATVIE